MPCRSSDRRRRIAEHARPKPLIMSAQLAGSGAANMLLFGAKSAFSLFAPRLVGVRAASFVQRLKAEG
jgi:hypothetical protein